MASTTDVIACVVIIIVMSGVIVTIVGGHHGLQLVGLKVHAVRSIVVYLVQKYRSYARVLAVVFVTYCFRQGLSEVNATEHARQSCTYDKRGKSYDDCNLWGDTNLRRKEYAVN